MRMDENVNHEWKAMLLCSHSGRKALNEIERLSCEGKRIREWLELAVREDEPAVQDFAQDILNRLEPGSEGQKPSIAERTKKLTQGQKEA